MTHIYRGWTIARNGMEFSYRKGRHEMWRHACSVREAQLEIDLLESTL